MLRLSPWRSRRKQLPLSPRFFVPHEFPASYLGVSPCFRNLIRLSFRRNDVHYFRHLRRAAAGIFRIRCTEQAERRGYKFPDPPVFSFSISAGRFRADSTSWENERGSKPAHNASLRIRFRAAERRKENGHLERKTDRTAGLRRTFIAN